jgi:hypothetical protein
MRRGLSRPDGREPQIFILSFLFDERHTYENLEYRTV